MKSTQIADGVYIINNFLSDKECQKYIDFCENKGFEKAHIASHRNNDRLIITRTDIAETLWGRLSKCLNLKAVGLNECFRFYKYSRGQEFKWHADGSFKRSNGEESRFTILFYLNHSFKGGETKFKNFSVLPETGKALIFKHSFLHQGAPVRKGVKYVLRSDVMFNS